MSLKIIHTSDWHLGQRFYNHERTEEQDAFLDWLYHQLVALQVDVLLISGDVFDTLNPSAAALKLYYSFIAKCVTIKGLQVIVTAGNHDSPSRLNAPSALMSALHVEVVTAIDRQPDGAVDLQKLLFPLYNRQGELGAYCLAIPFLRMSDLAMGSAQTEGYPEAVDAFYTNLITEVNKSANKNTPLIAMGHFFATQSTTSDSERSVCGGLEVVMTDRLADHVAYLAMGHIHKAQKIAQRDFMRYSGSPYPLSFSEIQYKHQVVLVTVDTYESVAVEPLLVPRRVDMVRVGTPSAPLSKEDVFLQLAHLPVASEELDLAFAPFLEIHVALPAPDLLLGSEIATALNDKYVRYVGARSHYPRVEHAVSMPIDTIDDLMEITPKQMFEQYYESKYGHEVPDELVALFEEVTTELTDKNH